MHIKKSISALTLLAIASVISCKKSDKIVIEKEIINITTPVSKFNTLVFDRRFNNKTANTINFIDSNFYFQNQSDSAANITYVWDFGDGTTSQLRHPAHSYKTGGTYIVKLITNKAEQAFDTTKTQLSVIAGQREFEWEGKSVNAVDIVEKEDGDLLFLGFSTNKNVYPPIESYFLITLDKDLRQRSIKIMPSNIKLFSIERCLNGTYICTGNLQGTPNHNSLINITAEGTILWSKVIGDYLASAQQTADQGFILTGSKSVRIDNSGNFEQRTLVTKTDANGNVVWNRLFSGGFILKDAYNIVAESNGYTLAGIKPRASSAPYCEACDSVCLVRLNTVGKISGYTTIEAALNTSGFGMVHVDLGKTGNYIVTPGNTKGIFIFSPQRKFLDRKLMAYTATLSLINNGDVIALQQEYGNGFRTSLGGYSETGTRKWSVSLDGNQYIPGGGYSCCADSWPVMVKKLTNGQSIFMSNKVDVNDYHYIATLIKVDANGKIM